MRLTLTVLAAGAALALTGPNARAQQCVPPDLVEALPPDGATGVPTDAALRGRYAITAGHAGEVVRAEQVGSGPVELMITFDEAERTLVARPVEPWVPGAEYLVTWPELQATSEDEPAIGDGGVTRFTAGTGPDLGPPTIDAIELDWFVDKPHDDCTDSAPERFFFDVSPGTLSDDGPVDALTVIVLQTAGPEMGEGATPLQVFSGAATGGAELALPRAQALGEVCFAAVARDLSDNISPASPEVCTHTRRPPFWEGCTVAHPGQTHNWLPLALLMGAWCTGRTRRRHHCRR